MLQNINSELWDVNPELQEEKGIFCIYSMAEKNFHRFATQSIMLDWSDVKTT